MEQKGIGIYTDLIMYIYRISNPIEIAEMIEYEFDVDVTIHQITDYLDVNRKEDWESESNKMFN